MERRLAAILIADVVGYSRLMEADEAGTLVALKERLVSVFNPTVRIHSGRIVKTMGTKIVKLQPVGGFCAETAGAATLFFATFSGIPVSTTHTITGSIVGVGSAKRFSAVKWGVAGRIVWAWVLTIPMAALIAGLTYGVVLLIEKITGTI